MRRERRRLQRTFLRRNLPRQLATFLPWYRPERVRLPEIFEETRARYSALAVSIG